MRNILTDIHSENMQRLAQHSNALISSQESIGLTSGVGTYVPVSPQITDLKELTMEQRLYNTVRYILNVYLMFTVASFLTLLGIGLVQLFWHLVTLLFVR